MKQGRELVGAGGFMIFWTTTDASSRPVVNGSNLEALTIQHSKILELVK
jgi:hypothetical protein